MPFGQALLHSYSLICRERGSTAAPRSHGPPRGLFSGSSRAHLPARPSIVARRLSYGQTEKHGQRVLCRCFSLNRAASLFQAAGSLMGAVADDSSAATPILAKMALQGFTSGMTAFDPFFLDMAAGMLGHTVNHGADRLRSYASEELERQGGVLGGKERLMQLAAYCAFVDTPIMHTWQDFLENVAVPSDPNGPLTVALKVILDQGLMAPLATILMLLTLKLLEGGDPGLAVEHARQQLRERLLPDYTIWPLARVVQYSLIPSAAHPLFEGAVSVMSAAMQVIRHKKRKSQEQEAYAPTPAFKDSPQDTQRAVEQPPSTSPPPAAAPGRNSPPAFPHAAPTAQQYLAHHPLATPRSMTPPAPPHHHTQSRLSRQSRSTDSSPFNRQHSNDATIPAPGSRAADQPLVPIPPPPPAKIKVWQGVRPLSPFAINSHVPLDALDLQASQGGDLQLSDRGSGSGTLHHSGQLHVRCSYA